MLATMQSWRNSLLICTCLTKIYGAFDSNIDSTILCVSVTYLIPTSVVEAKHGATILRKPCKPHVATGFSCAVVAQTAGVGICLHSFFAQMLSFLLRSSCACNLKRFHQCFPRTFFLIRLVFLRFGIPTMHWNGYMIPLLDSWSRICATPDAGDKWTCCRNATNYKSVWVTLCNYNMTFDDVEKALPAAGISRDALQAEAVTFQVPCV